MRPTHAFATRRLLAISAFALSAAVVFTSACGSSGESSTAGVTIEPAASPTMRSLRTVPTAAPTIESSPTLQEEIQAAQAEPTEVPVPTADSPPTTEPPAAAAPTATAVPPPPPPPPPPAATGSLAGQRIYSNGDSTSFFMSVGVLGLAAAQGAIQVQPEAEYKLSSGLLGGASFDWYGYMASEMATYSPDIVVFMIGANDAHVGMDLAAYSAKVGQMMDQLSGKRLIWVGQPNMARPDLAASVPGMNQIYAAEAAKRPWVRYVDTWSLTSDPTGAYTPYTPDGSLARGDDGVHFTSAGGAHLAQAVIAAILGG